MFVCRKKLFLHHWLLLLLTHKLNEHKSVLAHSSKFDMEKHEHSTVGGVVRQVITSKPINNVVLYFASRCKQRTAALLLC